MAPASGGSAGSVGEDRAQGGRDVGVGADAAQPSVAEAGELAGQVRILFAVLTPVGGTEFTRMRCSARVLA